jgi:hypothetical protein
VVLTIEEFNAAASAHRRRLLGVIAAPLVTIAVCFAVVIPFKSAFRGFFRREFGEVAAEVFIGLTPLPALLVLAGVLWWHQRRARWDARLLCPHCGKRLVDMQFVVVATRNCGHCGKQVLAEPPETAFPGASNGTDDNGSPTAE